MTRLITLIPAYKTDFLAELFLGLATQSHRDFKVVLSDDSPGAQITSDIRSGRYDELLKTITIHVVQGPRLGSLKNIQHLLRGWAHEADLVHIHLDDDVIYPDFYREHVRAHSRAALGASVSLRWVTDSQGRPLLALPLPDSVEQSAARMLKISSEALFASTVPACANWLGETSNTVFSLAGARCYHDSHMAGLSYYGLSDIGSLLNVSRQAPIAFIRDHLSGFRSNPQQSSSNLQSFALKCGHIAWTALALAARRDGRITDEQALQSLAIGASRCLNTYGTDPSMTGYFGLIAAHASDLDALDTAFASHWERMLANDPDAQPMHPMSPRRTSSVPANEPALAA